MTYAFARLDWMNSQLDIGGIVCRKIDHQVAYQSACGVISVSKCYLDTWPISELKEYLRILVNYHGGEGRVPYSDLYHGAIGTLNRELARRYRRGGE